VGGDGEGGFRRKRYRVIGYRGAESGKKKIPGGDDVEKEGMSSTCRNLGGEGGS